MALRVLNQLRRRIESHRLTVKQRATKSSRVIAFKPRRNIGNQRKACRMRLGKPVVAEAFYLIKQLLGKTRFIASIEHARDEFLAVVF